MSGSSNRSTGLSTPPGGNPLAEDDGCGGIEYADTTGYDYANIDDENSNLDWLTGSVDPLEEAEACPGSPGAYEASQQAGTSALYSQGELNTSYNEPDEEGGLEDDGYLAELESERIFETQYGGGTDDYRQIAAATIRSLTQDSQAAAAQANTEQGEIIFNILQGMNRTMWYTEGDGDCMFQSVSMYLEAYNKFQLRAISMQYAADNKDHYTPFYVPDQVGNKLLTYDEMVSHMKINTTWSNSMGDFMILVIANAFSLHIAVITANMPIQHFPDTQPITDKSIVVVKKFEHYMPALLNGVRPFTKLGEQAIVVDPRAPDPRRVAPQVQPQGRSQVRPQGRPQVRPQGQPQVRPQGQPQVRPQGQPQVRPQGRPQGRPQARPQGQPQVRPQGQPQVRPQGQLPDQTAAPPVDDQTMCERLRKFSEEYGETAAEQLYRFGLQTDEVPETKNSFFDSIAIASEHLEELCYEYEGSKLNGNLVRQVIHEALTQNPEEYQCHSEYQDVSENVLRNNEWRETWLQLIFDSLYESIGMQIIVLRDYKAALRRDPRAYTNRTEHVLIVKKPNGFYCGSKPCMFPDPGAIVSDDPAYIGNRGTGEAASRTGGPGGSPVRGDGGTSSKENSPTSKKARMP